MFRYRSKYVQEWYPGLCTKSFRCAARPVSCGDGFPRAPWWAWCAESETCSHCWCNGLSLWLGRSRHGWCCVPWVGLVLTSYVGVFWLQWVLNLCVLWRLLLVPHFRGIIELYRRIRYWRILFQLLQGGNDPLLPRVAVRLLSALCWAQG